MGDDSEKDITRKRRDALSSFADRGGCVGSPPGSFYPGTDSPGFAQKEREAKAVCGRCPVRRECLTYALDYGESFGIWGGYGERGRRRLRRRIERGNYTIEDALKDG